MKKILLTFLSVCAVGCVATACGKTNDDSSSTPDSTIPATPVQYTFQVLAASDVALGDVGAKLAVYNPDGSLAGSLRLDNSGKRERTLMPAEYIVRLQNENGDTVYETKTDLTGEKDVLLYYLEAPASGEGYDSVPYQIDNGYYSVSLAKNASAFYAFTPKKAGTYRIRSIGSADVQLHRHDGSEVWINPAPSLTVDDSDGVNFSYEFQVTPNDLASLNGNGDYQLYFSMEYADKATDFSAAQTILYVDKISDDYDVETPPEDDAPTVITPTKADEALYDGEGNVVPFGAQEGTLTPLPYNAQLVYNETDRYYHYGSKDGALVVMPFTVTPTRLLDVAFNVIGNPTLNENALPSTLHLTSTDEATGKVTITEYNTLINEIYPSAVNGDGMYPLTQEMYEFVTAYVAANASEKVALIPADLRWKAPLYYYETGTPVDDRPDVSDWTGNQPTSGNGSQNSPYVVGLGDYCAPFGPTFGVVYYTYTVEQDGFITVSTDAEKAAIAMVYEYSVTNGDQFTATTESGDIAGANAYTFDNVVKGGKILLQICTSDWTSAELPFSIRYSAQKPKDESLGSADKPYALTYGETTAVSEGKTILYYVFTPTETGTYTISSDHPDLFLYVRQGTANGTIVKKLFGKGKISFNLTAGESYYIAVSEGVNKYFSILFNFQKA
ncbi:MAG: hypothetical protein J6A87_01795 [Clostridia bacterium]|nr:hypothetical protein [Clostridia bacterium]